MKEHALGAGQDHGPATYSNQSDPRYYSFLADPAPNATQDLDNVDAALQFINGRTGDNSSTPWMMFLPLLLPHPPYSCPEPWYSMVDRSVVNVSRPADLKNKPDFHRVVRNTSGLDRQSPEMADATFREARAIYLGSIAYSDYLLGQLLDALDATGQADDTVVVVFSDHGDYAGDYGLVEKWPSGLEDVLTRVPLYVRGANLPLMNRGGAATWIFRGEESRRCRGCDVDIQWRCLAATPLRRG